MAAINVTKATHVQVRRFAHKLLADDVETTIGDVGDMSFDVEEEPPPVSSTCVVFAKSEATGLLREGWSKSKVLAAYCSAMAHRVCSLLERIGVEKELTSET